MVDRETVQRALAMEPGRIGVGRLCQELLAETNNLPLPERTHPEQVKHCSYNQYGRTGEPQ